MHKASPSRRDVILTLASAAALAALPGGALAAETSTASATNGLVLGPPQPFSFDKLKEMAKTAATTPWVDGHSPYGKILDQIDYDAFQSIVFRKDHALWADKKGGDPIQLFHLGKYFQEPAKVHIVENGQEREILYRREYFDLPANHPARQLPDDIGYSGFRIEEPNQNSDWMAFLGASYFRSSGALDQYGLSARGLAVDTAMPTPEEFPRFSGFWMERVLGEEGRVIVYCMLDSPSVTGAYRMDCVKKTGAVMDIDCFLYPRKPIQRLGIAPLTSMYWYSETVRRKAIDWRPEVHDSDGLAIWTGVGERIWRPLNNPSTSMTNSFLDTDPRGFGLLQRDRNFDHYQDDGVFYDRRPSVWVETKGKWGKGAVQLVELPTDRETDDNIVAYWVPEEPIVPGKEYSFSYRLFWDADEPYPTSLARISASYVGVGGIPGQPRPPGAVRFVVDFHGGNVEKLKRGDTTPSVTLSRGSVTLSDSFPVVGQPGLYRAFFDTVITGTQPLDIRLYVQDKGGSPVSETWLYQYIPGSSEFDRS